MSHRSQPDPAIITGVQECNIISPESLLPETARFPGGPFHLSASDQAPTIADWRSAIAATTRSAMRAPV
jgi:hypothetical protein